MGPWASQPRAEELAVAFYRDGAEIRRFMVADLVQDTNALPQSVSHHMWLAEGEELPAINGPGEFQLRMLEDRLYTFEQLVRSSCGCG
ncbi:MAG: hypothetical protein KJO85_02330 [Gammaproteobacteria bacterium]|nr:hypothetical protein [Gammaproteobacteria bacterium]